MRIGMVLDRPFPPDDRVEKEARSLIGAGHKLFLLCFKHHNEPDKEVVEGIQVQRVFMPKWLFNKLAALILVLPFYNWFWQKKMSAFVRRNHIEALHIHDLPLVGVGLKIKQEFGIPLIADMHENYPVFISEIKFANTLAGRLFISKRRWFRKEKDWLKQTDRIVTVANGMKERIAGRLGLDRNIIVVPNSPLIQSVLDAQKDLPELKQRFTGKYVLFYFGGLDSRRGLDVLLHAVAKLKRNIPNIALIIAGAGSYQAELNRMIKKLNLGGQVFMEGWQPIKHIKAYLSESAVAVIPHMKSVQTDNSSPNKLFLYMLFGKPVVSSNCQSIQKVIEEQGSGLIFESGNKADLERQILNLYQNPDKAAKMGRMGQQAVQEKYDWSITVKPLIAMYKDLAQ